MSLQNRGKDAKRQEILKGLAPEERNMSNAYFKNAVEKVAKNEEGYTPKQRVETLINKNIPRETISDLMNSAVNQPNSDYADKIKDVTEAVDSIPKSAEKAGHAARDLNKNLKFSDAEKSTAGFASKFKTKMSDGVEKTKAKLSEFKGAIKDVGIGLKETMVANLPAVLLAAGTAAAAGVNALANNIRSRALNAGTKNLNKYNKKINKSQSKLESVNDIKAEFNRLAKGVDNTTNQNVGLSESDYSRYLELKKQLVKTNKDLVKSMDSEGNAIIDNNSAIDKSIKKYERQIQKNKQAIASKKNLAIQNKAAALNMNKATKGYQVGDRSLAGNVGRLLTGGKKGVGIGGALIGGAIGTLIAPGVGTALGAVIGNGAQAATNLAGQFLLGTKDSGALHSIFASKKSIASDGLNSNKSNLISMIKNTKAYKKEAKSILGKNADLDNLTDQQLSTLLNNANFDSGGLGVKDNTMSKYVEATKSNLKEVQDQLKEFKSTTLEYTLEASQGFAT